MSRTFLLITIVTFALFTNPAWAEDHREAARELMKVSGTQQIMSQMQLQIENMFLNISDDESYNKAQKEIVTKYRGQVSDILKSEMVWDKIENDVIDVYMASFTEKELKDMTAFYKTPLGQTMIEKMPEVMLSSAEIARQQMRYVIPQVKQLGQSMNEELSAAE